MRKSFEEAYKREYIKRRLRGQYFPELNSKTTVSIGDNCSSEFCKICKYRDSNNNSCMLGIQT